jgi:hypothetical protein
MTHKDKHKNARQTLVHLDRKRELKKQGVMPEQADDSDFHTVSQQKQSESYMQSATRVPA